MEAVDGVESYDFTTTIAKEYEPEGLPSEFMEKDFILKLDYKYSGKLSDKATICIPVGVENAGKPVCYAPLNENGIYGTKQNTVVDERGYIVVEQEDCLSYVVMLAYVLGDANGDSAIDAKDALAVLKYDVGIAQDVFITEAADADKDGEITAKDAFMILKHDVGIFVIQ